MTRKQPMEFLERPAFKPRRKRHHVAIEYRENEQIEVAHDLARPLTPRARQALGF